MKVVITLEDGKLPAVDFDNNGTKRSFHTNLRDILHIIEESYVDDEPIVEPKVPIVISPALPVGTVKYSFNSANEHVVFIDVPEFASSFTYHTTHFLNVPFPKMVFCFRVKENKVIERSVMAYKDKFLRDDTQLYRFPYANVHSAGALCYYEDREVQDLVQLQTFAYRWAQVPMNDHLYSTDRTTKNIALRELLEGSQGKPFDYDILKPFNKDFSEWAVGLTGRKQESNLVTAI